MNITFKLLRTFVEVAQRGSMIRAAEVLHLTPSAVSIQIKEIEAQIGALLFDRNNRHLSLTTAGECFVIHAKRLLAKLNEAENAMARLTPLDRSQLTIGIQSTAAYVMPH